MPLGTANGVLYLDGSKVVTSGSALTFDGTNLSTTGSISTSSTNGYNVQLSGGNAYRMYATANDLVFRSVTAGSDVMTLTYGGNLGIGTTSPATKLHVNTATAGYGITVAASSQTSITYQIGIDSNSNLAFYDTNAAAQRLVLSTSGNLGLGVTPSAWDSGYRALQVGTRASFAQGSIDTYVGNNWINDGTNKYIGTAAASLYGQTAGVHAWYTAPSGTAGNPISFTQAMTLDASGNLSLGQTSATYRLDIGGTNPRIRINETTGYVLTSYSNTGGSFDVGRDNSAGLISGEAYAGFLNVGGAYPLIFNTNNTERARITSGGDLLVGTTSSGGKLTVSTGSVTSPLYVSTSGAGRIANFISTAGSDAAQFGIYIAKFENDSTTSQRFVGFSINNDTNGSGQINANGASQAAFGSFSDARLKENIVDLSPQLANVMALRPVEFDYKDGSGHQTGFIAQEMQQVYPDAIGEQEGFLTVTGYGKTEARLIKAIQEQQDLITALTARLAAAGI
jgi:hypothetical protein